MKVVIDVTNPMPFGVMNEEHNAVVTYDSVVILDENGKTVGKLTHKDGAITLVAESVLGINTKDVKGKAPTRKTGGCGCFGR